MKKLIIFDLDGVLVDACEWHRVALNKALKEVSNYEISLQDHYSTFNGIPTRVKLSKLTEMGLIDTEDHDRIYNRKQELSIEIIKDNATKDITKIKMIEELKNNGHTVACYTNSIRKTAHLMLSRIGVIDLLELLLTNQDVKRPKPDPEGYEMIIKDLNFKREDVIIVEDSPKGLQAAYSTGCKVLKVKDPSEVNTSLFKDIL